MPNNDPQHRDSSDAINALQSSGDGVESQESASVGVDREATVEGVRCFRI